MSRRYLTDPEYAAILAGLRALQDRIDANETEDLKDILTNSGELEPADVESIETLIDDMQSSVVQFR